MRRSEALGLRWKDVDLILGTIAVPRAMHVLKGRNFVFEEPKSKKGKRSIAMPPTLVIALTEHRQRMEGFLGPMSDADLVFVMQDGRPMRGDSVSHAFVRIRRKAGLKGRHQATQYQAYSRFADAERWSSSQGCAGTPRALHYRNNIGLVVACHSRPPGSRGQELRRPAGKLAGD